MDRFEDGLHRGFGHDDDFTSDDLAALRDIVAMTGQSDDEAGGGEADDDDPPRRARGALPTTMYAKRANQAGRQF